MHATELATPRLESLMPLLRSGPMMSIPEEELRRRPTILREEVLKVARASLELSLRLRGLEMLPPSSWHSC